MKKRRFAEGGFSDIDEGRDTPDQALARKASMSSIASSDKAAGLASTKGQDVGLKRLFMGNIDKPGSEASNSFGAGKGSSDRMAQAADQDLPVRPTQRPSIPAPPVVAPTPVATKPDKFSDYGDNADVGTIEYSPVKKPVVVKKPTVKPSISASDKPMPPGPMKSDDAMKMGRGRPAITGEIANLDSRAVRDRKSAQMMMAQDEKLRQKRAAARVGLNSDDMKKGGSVKKYASGGSVSSRGDGIAQRGKTRGMMR